MATPNQQLAAFVERSGLSNSELARRVKSAAHDTGRPHINPDASTVRRWILEGRIPRRPVPGILADVLSDALKYRVTSYELGLGESPAEDRSLLYSRDYAVTVETVADLGRADVDRRKFLAVAPFAAVAAIGPSRDWLLATLDQSPDPGPHVRLEDVTAVRNMFGEFQKMDIFQGGGSGRLLLAAYMNIHVYPLLRRSQSDDVRRALCEAAAEQTYLLGWMAYDNGEHGTAQRYLIQSLRLAEESKNAPLGAHVLAGMADQATLLGHPEEGLRLAQSGRHGLQGASNACLADLWALEGRALAALGEKKAAAHAVVQSETAAGQVDQATEQEWALFIDPAYLHGEHAMTMRDIGDIAATEEHARRSIDHARMQQRARRGAMSQAALASAHLQRRDLEAAYAAGLRTLSLTRKVKSSRAVEAVADLQKRMQPFGQHRLIADFAERARPVIEAAAA
ncbi:transcriptional regulator [Kitasatospora sp. MAP5-34]|uniref:transcriptional regulator n=1 Tax=Kitasatospora sp. MAP5-34 TaxID=3035102 RepID=UPI00247446B8|nr:transcriptional regulator [Kitasatospora sp. MAP5-34]MDH6578602.1 tetratricopeptide (TPR) repeat protein [Kitasatospora sp. MAP5-34]